MGADQSTLAEAEAAGIKNAEEAMQQGYEEAKRRDQERSLKRKFAKDAASTEQSPTVVPNLEPGEVMESSADSVTVPVRSDNHNNSSQTTPGASDILATFNPRNEREPKKKLVTLHDIATEDEFVGFRNQTLSQPNTRQPTKGRPQLDTAGDSITVGRKVPPTTSSKTSITPKVPPISAKASMPSSKRSIARTTSTEERKIDLTSLPKIQKRTSVASPQSPDRVEDQQLPSDGERQLPKWYKETQVTATRNKNDAGIDVILASLRDAIAKPKELTAPHHNQDLQKAFELVRNKLHAIVFQEVNPQVLKKNRTLHNEGGLPRVFDKRYSGLKWPFDIQADAKELYNKYYRQDFGTNMMRGIKFALSVKGKEKEGGDSIDPAYSKNVVSAKIHGDNDLVNGQWWPFQICCLRDGAHGVIQGGIFGAAGKGAYSCIISGGKDSQGESYPDKDEGDVVWYCGTDSDDSRPTAYTQRMLESVKGKPVRLIRSHNAHTEYAPEVGFRYDGLYDVTGVERMDAVDSKRQRHRFKLVRVAGQDPIRGGSGPQKRPTIQEIDEYNKHQRLSGKGKGQSSSKGN